jgi:hypothetical protein
LGDRAPPAASTKIDLGRLRQVAQPWPGATDERALGVPSGVRFGKLGPIRQWIESIIDTLKGQLSLEQHGARTMPGLMTCIVQRLLALAAAIWHNNTLWEAGHIDTPGRNLIAYDH